MYVGPGAWRSRPRACPSASPTAGSRAPPEHAAREGGRRLRAQAGRLGGRARGARRLPRACVVAGRADRRGAPRRARCHRHRASASASRWSGRRTACASRGPCAGSAPSSTRRRSSSRSRASSPGASPSVTASRAARSSCRRQTCTSRRLRAAGVEPEQDERRRLILEGLDAIGGWRDPAGVIEEVVFLVESPIVLHGRFDERFLELPARVVETAMQSHQRYFPLEGARFAFVANGGDPEVVVAGNERVLEGRLEDAQFTFERDVAQGDRGAGGRARLDHVRRGRRDASPTRRRGCEELVGDLGGGEASREAARLAKADQAAELVREFPDLEGHIGAEYARLAGFPEGVCAAIEEHYLPDSADGPLPHTEPGRVLAVAEKVDNLAVCVRARRAADRVARPVRTAPRSDRSLPHRRRGRAGDRRRRARSAGPRSSSSSSRPKSRTTRPTSPTSSSSGSRASSMFPSSSCAPPVQAA